MDENYTVTLIAAYGKYRVIGNKGKIPWYLPNDFKWFKKHSLGKPVIMGRKTYESIGKLLPDRANIILSRDASYNIPGAFHAQSTEQALEIAKQQAKDLSVNEIIIAGGGHVYKEFLPLANKLIITELDIEAGGDAFFPEFTENEWQKTFETQNSTDAKHQFPFTWKIFEK